MQPPPPAHANDSGDGAGADEDTALSAVAVALEQFMQTATLGEYGARLALLATFRRHAASQVATRVYSTDLRPCAFVGDG